MNITTKYNIGDTVWTVKDNKAYSFEAKAIKIEISECNRYKQGRHIFGKGKDVEIKYFGDEFTYRQENELVGSKEELINLL